MRDAFAQTFKDKVTAGQTTIQAQAEQMETMLESLDKGAEAERQLSVRITDKNVELNEVLQDLADKSYELDEVQLTLTNKKNEVREQEKAYFEKMLDLKYENECLKRENEVLKAENQTLKEKLNKAYDFMRQFTINGMNMLEHFLRSIGEWVQQKVAGMSR